MKSLKQVAGNTHLVIKILFSEIRFKPFFFRSDLKGQ